jgi:CRP-like cAMP-binding protein
MNGRPRNLILRSLRISDFLCLRPFLECLPLKEHRILQEPRRPIDYVNFVETGIVSLRTISADCVLEIAMIGSEGAVGMLTALGASTSIHQSIVLVAGRAFRIRVDVLQRLMQERPAIRDHFLSYVHALMVHSSQTALCGVKHNVDQRLASWLCLASDALGIDTLPITHEHLSVVLGLRRAGVTQSLTRFDDAGYIRKTRGLLRIEDRTGLQEQACCCYGVIRKSYDATNLEHHAVATIL